MRMVAPWRARRPGHYGRQRRAMSRGETLKSAPACLLSRLLTPGCRSDTGNGLSKPKLKSPTMTNQSVIRARDDRAPAPVASGVNRRSIRGRGRLGSLSKPRIGILRGRPVGALFAFRAGLGCYGAGGHVLYSYGSIAPTFTCLHFCNLTFQSFKGVSS
jgi:hypothetical protein